ncbi:hypothetical protein Wenmar_01111 [Wenxinia marina DSM 24838]|uniref:Uncharacterized protein n=1 Tax=Wenxinia marina DSM 24838 TaxID=1123501 RepID=A0A0D0QI89_9RHOB|nr:hypothetical protein Wenmar_01111 [Wenxinia marina DSM 24838]
MRTLSALFLAVAGGLSLAVFLTSASFADVVSACALALP